jgi:hypothetical protein
MYIYVYMWVGAAVSEVEPVTMVHVGHYGS